MAWLTAGNSSPASFLSSIISPLSLYQPRLYFSASQNFWYLRSFCGLITLESHSVNLHTYKHKDVFALWNIMCDMKVNIIKLAIKDWNKRISAGIIMNSVSIWPIAAIETTVPYEFIIIQQILTLWKDINISICFWHNMLRTYQWGKIQWSGRYQDCKYSGQGRPGRQRSVNRLLTDSIFEAIALVH